jgi:hypothetical protein
MPRTMLPTTEDIISDILNWVCPECGGPMGKRTKEFKCQGECRTDWRDVWECSLMAKLPSIECHFCKVLAGPFGLTPGNKEEFL